MTYIILSSSLGNVRSSVAKAMVPVTMTPKSPVYKLRVQVFSLGSLYFCVRVAPAEKTPAVPTKMYLCHIMREINTITRSLSKNITVSIQLKTTDILPK